MAPEWDGEAGCSWVQGAEDIDAPCAPPRGGRGAGVRCAAARAFLGRFTPSSGLDESDRPKLGSPLRIGVLRRQLPSTEWAFRLSLGWCPRPLPSVPYGGASATLSGRCTGANLDAQIRYWARPSQFRPPDTRRDRHQRARPISLFLLGPYCFPVSLLSVHHCIFMWRARAPSHHLIALRPLYTTHTHEHNTSQARTYLPAYLPST